ncbi:Basic region leucine zipper [Musa troglodytarum]|uniref:Basic region leucine zipper n=1 Tax=Musa troglodytarum TaxID=320322 RepID=A0A9E7J8E2_9LILI|nr:Basic region leucine zipper [Musa troglodytarum]
MIEVPSVCFGPPIGPHRLLLRFLCSIYYCSSEISMSNAAEPARSRARHCHPTESRPFACFVARKYKALKLLCQNRQFPRLFLLHSEAGAPSCRFARGRSTRADVASPSESRKMTSEDAEVTSGHRDPDRGRRQLMRPEQRDQTACSADRELDLGFALMAQTSIYSVTRDEIRNAVCEPRKTFGSMDMDEFLTSIRNVEEIQAVAANANNDSSNNQAQANNLADSTAGGKVVEAAAALHRQGSLTLPAPFSRKTVDEVWAEIHRNAALRSHRVEQVHQDGAGYACRQPTFGEMTLEDFLVKAGMVREGHGGQGAPSPHPQPMAPPPSALQQYEMTGFGHMVGMAGYVDEQVLGAAVVRSPASPLSSDGMARGQVDNSVPGCGADVPRTVDGVGRKRPGNGETVDKVVERRQRRMIKNRESAARSRARKQAYTVELEAELNVLKEENARLREEQRTAMASRTQLLLESMTEQSRINVQKAVRKLRRCNSSTW